MTVPRSPKRSPTNVTRKVPYEEIGSSTGLRIYKLVLDDKECPFNMTVWVIIENKLDIDKIRMVL